MTYTPGASNLPSSVFLITSDGRVLKLPIPSTSRRDPLNWSHKKRIGALVTLFVFNIMGLVQVQSASLVAAALENEYGTEQMGFFSVDNLGSSTTLFMGIGAALWIPLSLAIGRRPVFLLASALLLFSTAGAAVSQTIYEHLVARCLQGLAFGASGSVLILMLIDLTYIDQRPQIIASFWSLGGTLSNAILAVQIIIDGIKGDSNWRTFYWVWTGPCALAVLLAVFLCPETLFRRPAMAFDGHVLVQSASEKIHIYSDWNEAEEEKALPDTPKESSLWAWIDTLNFWDTIQEGGWKAMIACYSQIIICLLNPIIFWVIVLNAFMMGALVSISRSSSNLLQDAPYLLSAKDQCLLRFAATIGSLLAWPASGILIARIGRDLTARNRGYRDAEQYLPSFILPVLIGATSIAIYGIAGQKKWPLISILASYTGLYFSFISLFTANTLWATEAFPQWAAAALVVIGGVSYIGSFPLIISIDLWIQNEGFAKTHYEIGILVLVVGCVGIPMAFWGKRWRQYILNRWGSNEGGALRPQ